MIRRPTDELLCDIRRGALGLASAGLISLSFAAGAHDGSAHPDATQGDTTPQLLLRPLPDDGLSSRDQAMAPARAAAMGGANKTKVKNIKLGGRGVRLEPNATTDVWAHNDYAYTGTFNSPCGGEEGGGVHVWEVKKHKKAKLVGIIDSPVGSRSNDVKVASMNSGDVLVHSNEGCGGGPGGFEIYNVDDPESPLHLASIRIDEPNPISDFLFGGIADVGVHNLWLFTQGDRDYVAAVAETAFGNFTIFDITDPTNPVLVSTWGAEEVFDPGVGAELEDQDRVLAAALWLTDGVGASANRFLHDITINEAGDRAYLSNWDAGLVLLDISDPASPALVSVALDVENGSLDGELNSHSAWPNEDGTVVVEGEEDFSAWETNAPPSNLTFGENPTNVIPGTAASTVTGDTFEEAGNQTGNAGTVDGAVLTVDSGPLAGQTFPTIELSGDQPKFADTGPVSGNLVWIGRACIGDALANVPAAGDIAVVRRGACTFAEKLDNAAMAGAGAIVITNNLTVATPWSGMRIWDYSDPANPVLASTFDTPCSASTEPGTECNPVGTYSSHNVHVVGHLAYISWYSEGVVVLDVSDPYNPVEVGRYTKSGEKFEERNGGMQDVWGIYVDEDNKRFFASDRNGGLYIFKLKKLKKKKDKKDKDDDDDEGDD